MLLIRWSLIQYPGEEGLEPRDLDVTMRYNKDNHLLLNYIHKVNILQQAMKKQMKPVNLVNGITIFKKHFNLSCKVSCEKNNDDSYTFQLPELRCPCVVELSKDKNLVVEHSTGLHSGVTVSEKCITAWCRNPQHGTIIVENFKELQQLLGFCKEEEEPEIDKYRDNILVNFPLKHNSVEFAKLFRKYIFSQKLNFICVDTKKLEYYSYDEDSGLWSKDKTNKIILYFQNEFWCFIEKGIQTLCEKIKKVDEDKAKHYKSCIKSVTTAMRNRSKYLHIIQDVSEILFDADFEEELFEKCRQRNFYNLPFLNGKLNLINGQLEKYTSEDFMVKDLTTGYNFAEPKPEKIVFFSNVLKQIKPVEIERDTWLTAISTSMDGYNLQHILQLIGSGSNAKSMTNSALEQAMGNLCVRVNDSINTTSRGGPNPFLAAISNKRAVIYSEPDGIINSSRIKEITGGNKLVARMCHSNKTKVCLANTLIIETNHQLDFSKTDGAIHRRLVPITFPNKFTIDLEEVDEENGIFPANQKLRSDVDNGIYRCAFVRILQKYYQKYYEGGRILNLTDQMKGDALSQCSENDDFYSSGILSVVQNTNNKHDFVIIDKLYGLFKKKEFYRNMTSRQKRKLGKIGFRRKIEGHFILKKYFCRNSRLSPNTPIIICYKMKEFEYLLDSDED